MPRKKKLPSKDEYFKTVMKRIAKKKSSSGKLQKIRTRCNRALKISESRLAVGIDREHEATDKNMAAVNSDEAEDYENEQLHPPPPPPSRHAAFVARLLDEAKTALDAPPSKSEEQALIKRASVNPARGTKKVTNYKKQQLCDRIRTAVSLCKMGHFRLECDWFFSDLNNKCHTWYLQLSDYRYDTDQFVDGERQHEICDCEKFMDLIKQLARRINRDMESEANRLYDAKSYIQKMQDYKAGIGKMELPPLTHIEQQLLSLSVNVLHNLTSTAAEGNGNGCEKDDKEKDKNSKKDDVSNMTIEAVKKRQKARKVADTAALAKKMQDQADRKKADQKRVEAAVRQRTEAQVKRNAEEMKRQKAAKKARRPPRERAAEDEAKRNASQQKRRKEKKEVESKMTDEELKALRGIRVAAREEAERLNQVEGEEEQRQQQEGAEQNTEEDRYESAMMDAFDNAASPEPEAGEKVEIFKERKKRPKLRVIEDSEDSDNAKSPKPSKPVAKTTTISKAKPEPKAQPVATAPPAVAAPSMTAVPTMSLGDWLTEKFTTRKPSAAGVKKIEKSAAIATLKVREETESEIKPPKKAVTDAKKKTKAKSRGEIDIKGTTSKPSKPSEKARVEEKAKIQEKSGISAKENKASISQEKPGIKTKKGKAHVANEFISDSDLSSSPEDEDEKLHSKSKGSMFKKPTVPFTERADSSNDPIGLNHPPSYHRSHRSSPQHQPTEPSSRFSSPGKRKCTSTPSPQSFHETDDNADNAPASPPKKRKTTSQISSITAERAPSSEPSNPTPSDQIFASSEPATEARIIPPSSSGAASLCSSTSSSSSTKRKMTWSEDDGEVTISPGGTKRAKRVQAAREPVSVQENDSAEAAETTNDVLNAGGQGNARASVGGAEASQVEDDEDAKSDWSFSSLFDEWKW